MAEATSLHEKYPGPKTLLILDGARHLDWMTYDSPRFQDFVARFDAWTAEVLDAPLAR